MALIASGVFVPGSEVVTPDDNVATSAYFYFRVVFPGLPRDSVQLRAVLLGYSSDPGAQIQTFPVIWQSPIYNARSDFSYPESMHPFTARVGLYLTENARPADGPLDWEFYAF